MISSISLQKDIAIYLTNEEVNRLPKETLEGVLIDIASPKRQGTLKISVNDARKNENGFGIGIDDKAYWGKKQDFHLDIFVGTWYYQALKERGRIGTRHCMRDGSQIELYDRSKVTEVNSFAVNPLEFYRDNKEKLLADKTGVY